VGGESHLANVYLHYALDLWAEKVMRRQLRGEFLYDSLRGMLSCLLFTVPDDAHGSRRRFEGDWEVWAAAERGEDPAH